MKRSQMSVPPRPKMRSHPERHIPVTMASFYGIVYSFDEGSKWESVVQDYIKIDLLNYKSPENSYRLEAVSGNQKLLDFIISSSTKANVKGTFVKWSNETTVHGARFSKPDVAEEFCGQLCALSMDLLAKLQENAQKPRIEVASRKASVVSAKSDVSMSSLHRKASTIVIEILLKNNTSFQISVDKEISVSSLLQKICQDEKLNQSFYAIHYVSPANTPVPLDSKIADLECFQLRLVDKRDLQRPVSLNLRNSQFQGHSYSLSLERPTKRENKASHQKVESDFVLDASDPLVKAFLEIANIHQYELRKPHVHSIVEEFIVKRGGLQYLMQLRDSKLSRQALDEIGEISQKVLSLAESPTKPVHQYKRVNSVKEAWSNSEENFDLRRAYSVGYLSPSREMEKKKCPPVKKKRQAPLPPGHAVAHARTSPLKTSDDTSDDRTVGAKSPETKDQPRVKRRAPLPPGAVHEKQKGVSSQASSNITSTGESLKSTASASLRDNINPLTSDDVLQEASRDTLASPEDQDPIIKSPPAFSVPPPPIDSPPNDLCSPVEPLPATTPSPTKEFKFMGELARKLEARRSLIIHSDEDESVDHEFTPRRDYGTDASDTPSENHSFCSTHTPTRDYNEESTPVKNFQDSYAKPIKGQSQMVPEELAIANTSDEDQHSVGVVANYGSVADDEKRPIVGEKAGSEDRKDRALEGTKKRSFSMTETGYSVQLLEHQMKTISDSIRLIQEATDHKQNELLLKPLLLQQTLLQKMIDQERAAVGEDNEAGTNSQLMGENAERLEAAESKPYATVVSKANSIIREQDEKVLNNAENDSYSGNNRRKRLTPKFDSTQNDILVAKEDIVKEEAINTEKEEHAEVERLTWVEEEKLKQEEINIKKEREIQLRKEVERQKAIDEEKRRYEEQKRYIESEKRRKIELERKKQEEEQNRLDTETRQVNLLSKNNHIEEERGMEDLDEKEEKMVRREDLQKQEKYQSIKEEREKAELEKQQIDLAANEREKERSRLKEEVLKLKIAEQQRREQEESRKKIEELKELERLRKELEAQKKIENERRETEQKEIEELKRQLKEQREMQEKEARERRTLEGIRLKGADLRLKPLEVKSEDAKLFKVVKEIDIEDENSVSRSDDHESKFDESCNVQPEEEKNLENDVNQISSEPLCISTDATHAEVAGQSSVMLPTAPQSTTGPTSSSERNPSIRRPSSNLVSSAMRTGDGEASKKSTVGLFAKIQQLASARSNVNNVPSATATKVKNSSSVINEPKEVQAASDVSSGTDIASPGEPRNTNPMKELNSLSEKKGGIDKNESHKTQPNELSENSNFSKVIQREESIGDGSKKKNIKVSNHGRNENEFLNARAAQLEKTHQQSLSLATVKHGPGNDEVGKSEKSAFMDAGVSNISERNKQPLSTIQRNSSASSETSTSDAGMSKTTNIGLPTFASLSSFASSKQDGIAIDTAKNHHGNLANYRPKCISPDDLRSRFDVELEKNVEANQNTASSASVLRNALGKKVPPKVLPKTLPKTKLPKTQQPEPTSKAIEAFENQPLRDSMKSHIENCDRQKPEVKEKKKDYINLAAIPNRRMEISSGNISSNIMNRNIFHDDKKGYSTLQSGERGRTLPSVQKDDLKADETVASEPVQAPSLLRRLSQNSLYVDTAKPYISPRNSPEFKTDQGKLENSASGRKPCLDGVPNEVSVIQTSESKMKSQGPDEMRVGNFTSVMDINENETRQRDTVPVKQVGGLRIGFGRDKPRVYNS